MFDEIIKNIRLGKFYLAYYLASNLNEKDLARIIYDLGISQEITSYAFSNYLTYKEMDFSITQNYSQDLCDCMFNYLPGASAANAAHIFAVLEREPLNVDLLEQLLWLSHIPDDIFSSAEVYQIAKKVLLLNPKSVVAKDEFESTSVAANEPVIEVGFGLNGIEKTKALLEKGRFSRALENLSTHSWDELLAALRSFASGGNLFAYAFVWELIRKKETVELHLLGAEFFSKQYLPLIENNYFYGSEGIIFFHTYRAAELEPENIELQEKLLNLYEPGNESFDLAQTKALAERVLVIKPESHLVQGVLKLLK